MNIRPATQEDIDAIVALLRACGLFNPTLDYSEWSHPTLVSCTDEGRIVGLCQVILGRPYSYMTELAVHPEYQRQGVAKQLVEGMESIVKGCGINAWCAIILDGNVASHGGARYIGADIKGTGTVYMKVMK